MKLRKHKPDLKEIHQYILDLDRITLLRDKCGEPEEQERYTDIIEVMQLVLVRLQEK